MAISDELQNYADGLGDAYDAALTMGAVMPAKKNMNNLDATILTIPQPTVNDGTLTITQNGTSVGSFTANQASNTTVALTDTTYSDFGGATSSTAGSAGLVPAPAAGDEGKFLQGDGTWATVQGGAAVTEYYLSSDLSSTTVGVPFIIYTDDALTTTATQQDFFSSVMAGNVRLVYETGSFSEVYDVSISADNAAGYGDNDEPFYSAVNLSEKECWEIDWPTNSPYPSLQASSYRLQTELTAGTNITITGSTISATDTTYSDFVGSTGVADGAAGLVPKPLIADTGKFLQGDGTWGTPTDTTYTAGTNVSISAQNVISATDTTYSAFTGATSSVAGSAGLVPAPTTSDPGKYLKGDGTWAEPAAKLVEMSYGESSAWAKFIAAYNAGSIVYCRASSNANPGTGSQTRKAFMAYVNNATSPTSVEFQYVRSQSSKSDSQQCDQVFVYTLTNSNGGTWSVTSRDMATKINVDSTLNKTYSSGANASMTLGAKAMTGATSGAAGTAGIVPAPAAGDQDKVLRGDGTWGSAPVTYSTTEQAIGTWIDGSTIYRKAYSGTAAFTTNVASTIVTDANVKQIISCGGYVNDGFADLALGHYHGSVTSYSFAMVTQNGFDVRLFSTAISGNANYAVWVEYTK